MFPGGPTVQLLFLFVMFLCFVFYSYSCFPCEGENRTHSGLKENLKHWLSTNNKHRNDLNTLDTHTHTHTILPQNSVLSEIKRGEELLYRVITINYLLHFNYWKIFSIYLYNRTYAQYCNGIIQNLNTPLALKQFLFLTWFWDLDLLEQNCWILIEIVKNVIFICCTFDVTLHLVSLFNFLLIYPWYGICIFIWVDFDKEKNLEDVMLVFL